MSIQSTHNLTREEAEKLYYDKVREADYLGLKYASDKELEYNLEFLDQKYLDNEFNNYNIERR